MRILNGNGHSALHKAAVKGHARVCRWLLADDGAALGLEHVGADGDGNTPHSMARHEGHGALADELERAADELRARASQTCAD